LKCVGVVAQAQESATDWHDGQISLRGEKVVNNNLRAAAVIAGAGETIQRL
jgi:hypothetical protein